jgi:hypothetical protein
MTSLPAAPQVPGLIIVVILNKFCEETLILYFFAMFSMRVHNSIHASVIQEKLDQVISDIWYSLYATHHLL